MKEMGTVQSLDDEEEPEPERFEDDSELTDTTEETDKHEEAKKDGEGDMSDIVEGTDTEKVIEKGFDVRKSLKRKQEPTKISIDSCFEKVGKKGRRKVRCKVCFENPDKVQAHKKSKQTPSFCTKDGGEIRTSYMDAHLHSDMHLAACRANRLKGLKKPEIAQDGTTIDYQISRANKPLYGKIGGYMISVFNDAKRGTLSAWSWPSRQVAFMRADHFKCNGTMQNFSMSSEDFRYLSLTSHTELLDFVVKADLKGMGEVFTNSLAMSLRTDGAVDRMHIHNNHLGAKVIHQDGSDSTFFLGFGESPSGGAKGYLEAIMEACRPLSWESLFSKTSSLVTDGENMNTRSRNGPWALCDGYRRDSSSDLPLIKICCAAHRINLAWKSVTKEVQEVDKLIKDAASLSTYFRILAVQTKNLKKIAEQNEFQYFHFPRYFEVCWTQFCHELLESVLKNWRASIQYFENEQGQEARGYLNKWLDKDNIHLAGITADVLYIYKRFHQAFQDDNILIFDIIQKKRINSSKT